MTYNRPFSLRCCLNSLISQSYPKSSFEVAVLDVSTTPVDKIVEDFSQYMQIVYHRASNQGVAGNRNLGAKLARGNVLVFLDDDCIASPTWLEALVSAVQANPKLLAGGQAIHPEPKTSIAAAGQVITDAVNDFYNPVGQEVRFLPGLNFALDRQRFLALGGCDAGFGRLAAEDRDFVDRWRSDGGELKLCHIALVHHNHRSTLTGFLMQYFNYGRGAWRYHHLRRNRNSGRIWQDAKLHSQLPTHLAKPMSKIPRRWWPKVLLLIMAWQITNLAGFFWQAWEDQVSPIQKKING
jgi:GT2 family glycosyltransferase